MISSSEAFGIAAAAAQELNWGAVDETFKVELIQSGGKPAWFVGRDGLSIGAGLWFLIDAENGALLDKRRTGTR